MSMEKSGSESVFFYRQDLERMKEQAKAIRSEFLRKNFASILRGLAWAALVCGFAAVLVPGAKGPAAVATSSAETVLPLSKALSAQTNNDWMKDVTALPAR
jgi:hypothetical protein